MCLMTKLSRRNLFLPAQGCGKRYRLPYIRTGSHYPCGTKCYVAHANDPAGKKKVADVPTIQAAIRNLKHPFAMPLVTRLPFAEHPVGGMQVDGPSAVGYRVGMGPLLDQIPLRQHI